MKTINQKLEDSELKRMNYYRNTPQGGNTMQSNFIKTAIREKCERTRHLRAGGFILEIPNPDNFRITEDDKAKIMQVLKNADAELAGIYPAAGSYLTDMIAYLQYHFYKMTDKQRKNFEDNFERDLEFEAKLDEMEDNEFEEMQERGAKAFGDKQED